MKKQIAYIGLDVHKNSITMALFAGNSEKEEFTKRSSNTIQELLKTMKKLSEEYYLRVCYEASGCGYKIYRKLRNEGIDCIVAAPSLIPKENKKIKTDKIDAIKLAKYLRAGLLTAINVPSEEQERDRDLVRFRDFQVRELIRSKQFITAFLLRKGIDYSEFTTLFSKKFMEWISKLELSADDRTLLNRLIAHYDYQNKLIDELTRDIEELSNSEKYKDMNKILRAFRGIDTLTSMTILTHIADFRSFPHPRKLMSFIGLTTGEDSSGDTICRKGITKTGSVFLRKAFITASQHYNSNRTGRSIREKRQDIPSAIAGIVARADSRCRKRYYRLLAKNKPFNVAKTAVARELVGFIWEAMMWCEPPMQ